jgi:hypothetical protein
MDFDWKKIVGAVAPTLATALGGPLAGMATKAIAASLTGDENASEKEISLALRGATPETLTTLKQADLDFEAKLAELGVDLVKLSIEDRKDARSMQISTRSRIVPVLSVLTVAGFFVAVGWVLTGNVTLDSTLLGFVLGQISAKAEQVYNYFFGSSVGSKEKTFQLARKSEK